jgi:alkanesulfonate monooxygenase SsuD/methylene tetrahydromethanopterin reductase-like flavin-dependent oxidoreductase (luciferase family)
MMPPVTFNDIERRRKADTLLQDNEATEKAHSILNAELFQKEEQLQQQDQQLQQGHDELDNTELMQTAQQVVDKMQEVEAQGQDPMQLLAQVPPEVQQAVSQLLSDDDMQQQGQEQPQQDMQQLQQQPIGTTDMAKRVMQ